MASLRLCAAIVLCVFGSAGCSTPTDGDGGGTGTDATQTSRSTSVSGSSSDLGTSSTSSDSSADASGMPGDTSEDSSGTGGVDPGEDPRLRVIVETDIGGDADDQASLVRFLLYSNEWDVEGILVDRHPDVFGNDPVAENPTGARSAIEMAHDYIDRYAQVYDNLALHDPRYPTPEALREVTVEAHDDSTEGVDLLVEALMRDDDRPVWYGNWGSNSGTQSNLQRALARIEQEDPNAFATAVSRLRVSTLDGAEPRIDAAYAAAIPIYVECGWPQLGDDIEDRWYRRFDDITGPYLEPGDLHAFEDLYPGEKEGDSWSFVYLLPNGLNTPSEPTWGGAAGRYRPRDLGPTFYWNDAEDAWNGSTNRDNTAARWAEALQNDFEARLDWTVASSLGDANHPPTPVIDDAPGLAPVELDTVAGAEIVLSTAGTDDPDGDALAWTLVEYAEAGTGEAGFVTANAGDDQLTLAVSDAATGHVLHVVAALTDTGTPPLTRYRRIVLRVAK